jgi:IS605 OrfB family transposase
MKAIDTIKKIGSHEKKIVNDIVHNISRDIVNQAINTNAIIVLGDIKHLRTQKKIHEEKSLTESCPAFNTTS